MPSSASRNTREACDERRTAPSESSSESARRERGLALGAEALDLAGLDVGGPGGGDPLDAAGELVLERVAHADVGEPRGKGHDGDDGQREQRGQREVPAHAVGLGSRAAPAPLARGGSRGAAAAAQPEHLQVVVVDLEAVARTQRVLLALEVGREHLLHAAAGQADRGGRGAGMPRTCS